MLFHHHKRTQTCQNLGKWRLSHGKFTTLGAFMALNAPISHSCSWKSGKWSNATRNFHKKWHECAPTQKMLENSQSRSSCREWQMSMQPAGVETAMFKTKNTKNLMTVNFDVRDVWINSLGFYWWELIRLKVSVSWMKYLQKNKHTEPNFTKLLFLTKKQWKRRQFH